MMTNGYKEKLSAHVEAIFRKYSQPGLHICDIATGGGKSYTIGKLTCEYYPKYFDRIVILCVQKKLVDGMDKEIERFIHSDNSLLKDCDKLVIENIIEVTLKAIKGNYFEDLFAEMDMNVGELEEKSKDLKKCITHIKDVYGGIKQIANIYDSKNEFLEEKMKDSEGELRKSIRHFFAAYKKHLERHLNMKNVKFELINRRFPSLRKVYPQVDIANKKVLLLTVQKAMYGIDPILTEKKTLTDLSERNKKTLFLFDESDQASTAMRSTIIDQSIKGNARDRYAKGYNAFLQYRKLIGAHSQVYEACYGDTLAKSIKSAIDITNENWNKTFTGIETFNNIFLANNEELENYRRGVFFSGPIVKLNVAQAKASTHSFICYKKGSKNFTLVHSDNEEVLKKQYKIVVPMQKFLTLVTNNTTAIKSQLRHVVTESLKSSRKKFCDAIKGQKDDAEVANTYMGYPSLETEIHSLFSRFETTGESLYEQQLYDFITNRKNLKFGDDGDEKMPDYTVYSQGVQLYLEEIDERDNQHRVRLSSREITTTPEKMLVDLVTSNDNSVVLCSATASSRSVVSNFDIAYLRQVLGQKMSYLSSEDQQLFDQLMEKVSPKDHEVKVVPVEQYVYEDQRLNKAELPAKYKALFSEKAQEDGSADRWFALTKKDLEKNNGGDAKEVFFQLYRLFQYIEAYHWFTTHADIHSMVYFQNRAGDKDELQYNVLSCLIDGTHETAIDDELPVDWTSEKIKASKDWEEVKTTILDELSKNKDAKKMLITAYGSFKAGANLQYGIPDGLEVVSGDNWESDNSKLEKDWDAVFLQSPTSYLTMNEESEESLYNVMLVLMMLFERGCLSRGEVISWLNKALAGNLMFSEKKSVGVKRDKAAWAQTTIEQAVGRLCRTRNKPATTYILYDLSMVELLDALNFEKSMTREFRMLADDIKAQQSKEPDVLSDEIIRCNRANEAQRMVGRMLSNALRYTEHKEDDSDYDEDYAEGDELPYFVCISQKMNQAYKQTIIKKPVISSLDELDETDRQTTFIEKCYGKWSHHGNEGYTYAYRDNKVEPISTSNKPCTITASSVRLDVFMKNAVIRDYFKAQGYATDWNKEGMILHPKILTSEYAGEIGEEAFKALVMHYCNVGESDFKHLEGRDYELADFILLNKDGSYKVAFDVKNMCAQGHEDQENDMTTAEKRKRKQARLLCPLYTVNMLKLENRTNDALHEIDGLLTEDGEIVPQALLQLRSLINNNE